MTHSLNFSHEIFVPREILWEVWTRPEHLREWYAPQADCRREVVTDFRVGGEYAFAWTGQDGVTYVERGEFNEIDAPGRLVYSMHFDEAFGQPAHTRVTVEFVDLGGKTRIELTQEGYPDAQMRDQHAQGWPAFLQQLENYLSSI